MKRVRNNVSVLLTQDYKIQNASCECPNGQHRCSHMAVLAVAAYDKISCTDINCSWKRSNSSKTDEIVCVENFYGTSTINNASSINRGTDDE